jgi:hypothetical protein
MSCTRKRANWAFGLTWMWKNLPLPEEPGFARCLAVPMASP